MQFSTCPSLSEIGSQPKCLSMSLGFFIAAYHSKPQTGDAPPWPGRGSTEKQYLQPKKNWCRRAKIQLKTRLKCSYHLEPRRQAALKARVQQQRKHRHRTHH